VFEQAKTFHALDREATVIGNAVLGRLKTDTRIGWGKLSCGPCHFIKVSKGIPATGHEGP
jgi:hypothetical protein